MVKFLGTFVALVAIGYLVMVAVLPAPKTTEDGPRDGGRAAAARLAGEAAILVAPNEHVSTDRRRQPADRAS